MSFHTPVRSLCHSPPGEHARVASRVDGYEGVVDVEDDGDGILAEPLPHVVDAHDGSLAARRAGPGHGSTVEVRLPLDRGGTA